MKNKTRKFKQSEKIELYSRFSESNLEYVSPQDEADLISHIKQLQEKEFCVSYEERE